ncbi:hypothetical protein TNCV_2779221 [Trichonephila clavipes]|nr:hypothetical protein TNCV_2779221 [Trichonephila clavipes]
MATGSYLTPNHSRSQKKKIYDFNGLVVPEWLRTKSVAMFRLVSYHGSFREHRHCINVVSDSLCNLTEEMDFWHLPASPLVRLEEGGKKSEAYDHYQGDLPQNRSGTDPNRTAACMVL